MHVHMYAYIYIHIYILHTASSTQPLTAPSMTITSSLPESSFTSAGPSPQLAAVLGAVGKTNVLWAGPR